MLYIPLITIWKIETQKDESDKPRATDEFPGYHCDAKINGRLCTAWPGHATATEGLLNTTNPLNIYGIRTAER
jgi:hypothetical protein